MMMPTSRQVLLMAALTLAADASASDALPELSLEDLTKTVITSVARKSQSIARVPAAAFIISSDDIARSGAQALPDVLRMVPGIEVAQIDNGRYAVAARGFNGRFANKLQVLIDGRSIYHPIFSGVLWEHDAIALNDIDRIEVIRGPGAAMWGANATSGVINIISKHSRDDRGGFVEATVGTQGKGNFYGRHASAIDDDSSLKFSLQGRHASRSDQFATDAKSADHLNNGLADLRFDRNLGGGSDLAVWASTTRSSVNDLLTVGLGTPPAMRQSETRQDIASHALSGRYRWLTGAGIESSVKASFNAFRIEYDPYFDEERKTYDLDYQGRYTFASHDVVWGISHRTSTSSMETSNYISMRNPDLTQRTTGFFIQDDWTLIPDTLQFGIGARRDHNTVGGSTFAPNATLMWTPSHRDTVWAKYARAPRLPAQAERDVSIIAAIQRPNAQMPLPVALRHSAGGERLDAEKMEGIELGYRTLLSPGFNIDVSAYRYRYSGRIAGRLGATDMVSNYPYYIVQDVQLCNCSDGWLNGAELSADWLVRPTWRLQLSYSWTLVQMDDSANPVAHVGGRQAEQGSPRHYGSLRSQWNISANRQFDAWIRGSAGYKRIDAPYTELVRVPGYITLDLRYAVQPRKNVSIAVTGRNLIGARRYEFVSDFLPSVPVEVSPSVLLTGSWRF